MDRRGASLAPRSKQILAQGRRIASHLGATLYAVASENDDDNDNDTWISEAGLAGADKVVLLSFGTPDEGSQLPGNSHQTSHLAAAMMAVCDALSPNLVLLDCAPRGTAIAPLLAAHLAATVMHGVQAHFLPEGDVLLEERSPNRRTCRNVSLSKSIAPVIATISIAGVTPTKGQDDADVIFFKAPRSFDTLPGTDMPTQPEVSDPRLDGPIVVCAGIEALPVLTQVRALASVLGAPLVSTQALASQTNTNTSIVDQDGHTIAPRLYICCGDDGEDRHLSAIALGTQIVSLGLSPRNSSVSASRYALLGPLAETLSALLDAISECEPAACLPSHPMQHLALTPVAANTFRPCPDATELFSDPSELLGRLRDDGLWTP